MEIAVIGSGTMGLGIAQAFAAKEGNRVTVCIEKGKDKNVERQRFLAPLKKQVEKGKMTEAQLQHLDGRVLFGPLEMAADKDLVIESVFEDPDCKTAVLKELDQICAPDTILTTNTSSISISELGKDLNRPLAGMHFFNPAAVMKLVEIIPGERADEQLIARIEAITAGIGKVPVIVKNCPGFVVNRVLIPMINEAIGLLAEGVASAEGIDNAMKFGANQPMGPLALGDLIGLDVCYAIMAVIFNETKDEKYKPHPLLKEMADNNLLGRKTGRGFFAYG